MVAASDLSAKHRWTMNTKEKKPSVGSGMTVDEVARASLYSAIKSGQGYGGEVF
jgi:hypothetical protein